jgi:hypothetical protein
MECLHAVVGAGQLGFHSTTHVPQLDLEPWWFIDLEVVRCDEKLSCRRLKKVFIDFFLHLEILVSHDRGGRWQDWGSIWTVNRPLKCRSSFSQLLSCQPDIVCRNVAVEF